MLPQQVGCQAVIKGVQRNQCDLSVNDPSLVESHPGSSGRATKSRLILVVAWPQSAHAIDKISAQGSRVCCTLRTPAQLKLFSKARRDASPKSHPLLGGNREILG